MSTKKVRIVQADNEDDTDGNTIMDDCKGFLPVKHTRPRHTDLSVGNRAFLHSLLQRLHHAIHVGRSDIATTLAAASARLCREAVP